MRVCLNMIVKNEAAVIERCLRSVRPYIHSWAIADTGSIDGTQEIVRKFLADLPGELIERPWVDFSTNRNEALELAKRYGDYALVMDADDVLEGDADFNWGVLDAAAYMLEILYGDTRYWRVAVPRLGAGWVWGGVLHEALTLVPTPPTPHVHGLRMCINNDGARSQVGAAEKFGKDAEVLRRALTKEPDNARYAFYLAQSLRDAGQTQAAILAYQRRVDMGGWFEEVYFSKLQIAVLNERIGAEYATIVAAYLDAYDFRPQRAEAPCELARYCRLQQRYAVARDFARLAANIAWPEDLLFIDRTVYEWRSRDEEAVALYYLKDYKNSARICAELLNDSRLPKRERERVRNNRQLAAAAMAGA